MNRSKWILVLLILCLSVCGMAHAQEDTYQTIADSESNITLGSLTAGGTMIGLTMNESATSGYVWKAANDSGLNLVMDETQPAGETESMLGLPGTHSFVFVAAQDGQGTVSVWFSKTWLHDAPAVYAVYIPYTCSNGMLTAGGVTVEKNPLIPETVQEQMFSDPANGSITFKKEVYELYTGKSTTIAVSASASTISKKGYTFASSDESVATVNSEGRVKAIGQGQCTILVTSKNAPDVWARFTVKVLEPVKKVTVTSPAESLPVGETLQLTAAVEPANADNKAVKWTISDKTIATVDENGVVTAIKKGSVTITAKSLDNSDVSGRVKLNITQGVTGVTIESAYTRVGVDYYGTVTAKILPTNATNKNMTWTSSDETIATVSGSKNEVKITGKHWGECVVTGVTEEGGYTCSITVLVGSLGRAISIRDAQLNAYGGPQFTLTNNSNIAMKKISFAIHAYDYNEQPVILSNDGDGYTLYADYNMTLYGGAIGSSNDLQYVRKLVSGWDGVARIEVCVTGWESLYTYPTTKGTQSDHYTLGESSYNWVNCIYPGQ